MVSARTMLRSMQPPKRKFSSKQGMAGYDNPRENIDPHIRTKAVSSKEIYADTISGSHYGDGSNLTGISADVAGNSDFIDLSGNHYALNTDVDTLSGQFYILSGAAAVDVDLQALSGAFYTLSGAVYYDGANIDAGTVSGALFVDTDYTTESGAYVANIVYGGGDTPPTASGFTQGTVYLQYTP